MVHEHGGHSVLRITAGRLLPLVLMLCVFVLLLHLQDIEGPSAQVQVAAIRCRTVQTFGLKD